MTTQGELKEVTLPDSGRTVRIKFIGPMLMNDIRKAVQKSVKRPEPPTQEVDYGNGSKKLEPNPLHPAYEAELSEYNTLIGQRFVEKLFRYGIDAEVDIDAVTALRADSELDLPADDYTVYVTRILVTSARDQEFLQEVILGRIQPTDKQVAEALDNFRGDLQGTAAAGLDGAKVGAGVERGA